MFSVLGRREIGGRTGTILEGESGANDPVGIALMIGMIEFAHDGHGSFWIVVQEFVQEMAVGLAVGLAGAALLIGRCCARLAAERGALPDAHARRRRRRSTARRVAARLRLPRRLRRRDPARRRARPATRSEIERFHTSLASLAEIVVFVALGLTIDLDGLLGASSGS